MPPEILNAPPSVGLIADPASAAAGEILEIVRSDLARFGLRACETQHLGPEAARAFARGAGGQVLSAWVVASPTPELARAVAAASPRPVLRVPVAGEIAADALSLLWPEGDDQTVREGVHATVAIGEAGARNAALFVVSLLALTDDLLRERWHEFRHTQTHAVLAATLPPV